MAKGKKTFIFTNKKNPPRAIMSTILGVLSIAAVIIVVVLTFQNGGVAKQQYGTSLLLAMVFAVTGAVLGAVSKTEKEMFYFFCYLGMILNLLALAAISYILYVGAFGVM